MKKRKKSGSKMIRNTIIVVAIILCVIVIALIFLSLNRPNATFNPKTYTGKLISDDFKIINASWNIYPMKWGENGLEIESKQEALDWPYICNECRVNLKSHWCKSYDWHIETQASGKLICHATIDGVSVGENNLNKGLGVTITPGITNVTFVLPEESMTGKLTPRENHNILVCCVSQEKSGEICDAIMLELICR